MMGNEGNTADNKKEEDMEMGKEGSTGESSTSTVQ